MGCSTSSQTSAVDTTRPSAKPEESNGASATGVANENGEVAEDGEPIQEGKTDADPADQPATAVTSVDGTAAAPPAGEKPEPAAASPSADAAAPVEAPAADSSAETSASLPEPAVSAPEPEPARISSQSS